MPRGSLFILFIHKANILGTTPGTKNVSVGHALLIWFTEWPHENQTLNKFSG